MEKKKYGKFISREIIEESKYPQITAPMVKYRGDRGGRDLTFEWCCVDKPLEMDDEPEVNEFDQYLLFFGSDVNNFADFQAAVLGCWFQSASVRSPPIVLIAERLRSQLSLTKAKPMRMNLDGI